jgi:hypothetical protein
VGHCVHGETCFVLESGKKLKPSQHQLKDQTMSTIAIASQDRALNIQKSWGTRRAAGYLRNRGVPLAEALLILARK